MGQLFGHANQLLLLHQRQAHQWSFRRGRGLNIQHQFDELYRHAQYDSPSSDLTVWGVNPTASGTAFSSGNIAPLYPLYNGLSPNVETNKSMVVTGRGTDVGSRVLVGATLKGWQWGTSDGLQSWGTNTVSQIVNGGTGFGSLLRFAFDSSGGFNEGTLSVGDSGGGVRPGSER